MTLTVAPISAQPPIQHITTPKGLTAWLVESHSIPMLSLEVAFRAGSAFDGEHYGLASFTASLLDEGTKTLTDRQFKENLERLGARFAAGADKLDLTLSLDTLTDNPQTINSSIALMADALKNPAFTPAAAKRIQAATQAALKRQAEDPGATARKAYNEALFAGHVYGTPTLGTPETVAALTPAHAKAYHAAHLTRANMVISAVGAITPEALAELLDEHFADIPIGEKRNTIAAAPTPITPQHIKIERPVPQATILMGHLGLSRDHPDYFATFVMNHILGGGAFTSRLMEEIREKRGLTYSVYSSFSPLPLSGIFTVQLATNNADTDQAAALVKAEIEKLQAKGVTEAEHADAINYLTGSFPLRLDSNDKILGHLSAMQMENLGPNYLETWTDNVKSVTAADVHRVAKEHLHPDAMIEVILGADAAID